MMGGLSPGLKRHSVSLFEGVQNWEPSAGQQCKIVRSPKSPAWPLKEEAINARSAGGRVTGADSIAEMVRELRHSVDAKLFEGDMTHISEMARRVTV